VPAGVFHDRTNTSSHTTTSPWFPEHSVKDTCRGLPGAEMSRTLNPNHVPWKACFPQNAMSVWMFGSAPARMRLRGSSI
jgi:hypothetical protein